MTSQTMDVTVELNRNNIVTRDIGEWESLTIQAVSPAGTINIQGSNDAGDVEGVYDGSASTAVNFVSIQAVNLSSGATATAITTGDLYRISPVAFKFLRLGGAGAQATKLIINLTKPY